MPSPLPSPSDDAVLSVEGLRTFFFTYDGIVRAIDGVSFQIRKGETLGLVGETGCGKSVTAFSITRLIPDPPGRIVEGKIVFRGANLLWGLDQEARFKHNAKTGRMKISRNFRRVKAGNERMTAIRGKAIGMIFQEPSQAMNPIFSISDQVGEALVLHRGVEIIDGLLAATPSAPEVPPAVDRWLNAVADNIPANMLSASRALADAVHCPSFATQAYYIARQSFPEPRTLRADVLRAIKRLRLAGSERAYLLHRRREILLGRELQALSVREMTAGRLETGRRARLHGRQRWERLGHFYYGVWGIRGRIQRPLKEELFWRVVAALETVSVANPVQVARGYPHELSGGMIQRVMIAMALAPQPALLIADEPTTALDVTVQAQILELMRDLKHTAGSSILLITHDLAVIAEVADRVCVMYAGQIVESGPVAELYERPLHPYAQGLLASIPRIDRPDRELASIPGSVPNLINPPSGCRFHPRCPYAMPVCKQARPPMTVEGIGHTVACYLYKGPVADEQGDLALQR
jgi:peptide/nickel transport system ATP-binding protein